MSWLAPETAGGAFATAAANGSYSAREAGLCFYRVDLAAAGGVLEAADGRDGVNRTTWDGLLHRMGIARRRPKHVLEGKRDEAAHDRAKTELEALKKHLGRRKRTVVISQDETEFHLYPYLVAIWSVVGSPQPEVRTPGKNQKRVLYGGLNLKTGHLTSHWAATKSGSHVIKTYDWVLVSELG